jgi:hypothetical protein
MGDVFAVFADISPAVKFGWLVFVAWSAAQIVWFQRARLAPVPVKPARKRKNTSSARRPAVRASRPQPDADSTEILTSLGLLHSAGATQYGVPMSSGQSGPTVIS